MVGEIGRNEIDAVTISIISKKKKKKKNPFYFPCKNELLDVTKIFPIGCLPIYLKTVYTNNSSAFEKIWRVSLYF